MLDVESDRLVLRDVRGKDDESVFFQLYSAVRTEELGLADWAPAMRQQMLQLQFAAQRRGYRDQFPAADERLIVRDGVPIGWLIVDRSGTNLHAIDMALLSAERSGGVGTLFMRALQDEVAATGRKLVFSVLRTNVRAQSLYARLGCRETAQSDLHTMMEWHRE